MKWIIAAILALTLMSCETPNEPTGSHLIVYSVTTSAPAWIQYNDISGLPKTNVLKTTTSTGQWAKRLYLSEGQTAFIDVRTKKVSKMHIEIWVDNYLRSQVDTLDWVANTAVFLQ